LATSVENNEFMIKRKNILTFNTHEKLYKLNEANEELVKNLREKTVIVFNKHYSYCYLNNFINERLTQKDYIDNVVEEIPASDIWTGLVLFFLNLFFNILYLLAFFH